MVVSPKTAIRVYTHTQHATSVIMVRSYNRHYHHSHPDSQAPRTQARATHRGAIARSGSPYRTTRPGGRAVTPGRDRGRRPSTTTSCSRLRHPITLSTLYPTTSSSSSSHLLQKAPSQAHPSRVTTLACSCPTPAAAAAVSQQWLPSTDSETVSRMNPAAFCTTQLVSTPCAPPPPSSLHWVCSVQPPRRRPVHWLRGCALPSVLCTHTAGKGAREKDREDPCSSRLECDCTIVHACQQQ